MDYGWGLPPNDKVIYYILAHIHNALKLNNGKSYVLNYHIFIMNLSVV